MSNGSVGKDSKCRYVARFDTTALLYRSGGPPCKPKTILIRKGEIWKKDPENGGFLVSDNYPRWHLIFPENPSLFFKREKTGSEAAARQSEGLSHARLVTMANQILRRMGYPYIISEPGFRDEEPDAFGMSENMTCLIECKATRSDFLADRKKIFRIHPEMGIGRQRIYLVNKGVCVVDELPDGWQLIEVLDDHTVITETGDLKKHWNEKYLFENRNFEAEFRLMCSWAYRREHGCLKVPGPTRLLTRRRENG